MKESRNNYTQLIGIATQMMLMIGLGWWGGFQLDQYFGNDKPVYTLIIGLSVMFASLYITLKQINKYFDSQK